MTSATTNDPGYSHTARSGVNLTNFIQNTLNGGAVPGITPTINGIAIGQTTPAAGSFTFVQESVGSGLTAVGTNRATALVLSHQINDITTAASSTGAVLPSVASVGIGTIIIVFNAGANAITMFASGSDTIDTVAGATGVTLTNAKRCMYIAVAAATWISAQLGVVSA
jgi:hypothetical protein